MTVLRARHKLFYSTAPVNSAQMFGLKTNVWFVFLASQDNYYFLIFGLWGCWFFSFFPPSKARNVLTEFFSVRGKTM